MNGITSATAYKNNSALIELDQELIQYYLEHVPAYLAELKQAKTSKDLSQIRFQSHKLIPAMAIIEKPEIADNLRKLSDETISINSIDTILDAVIDQIELVLKNLKQPYKLAESDRS